MRGHQERPRCLWCSKRSLSYDSLSPGSVTRERECPPSLVLIHHSVRLGFTKCSLPAKQHAVRRLKVQFFSVVNPYVASSPPHPGCPGMKNTCHSRNRATSAVLGTKRRLLSMVPRALFLWTLFTLSALLTCFFYSATQCSSHTQLLPGPVYTRTSCLAVQVLFPFAFTAFPPSVYVDL